MKVQVIKSVGSLQKKLAYIFMVLCLIVTPAISICQPSGPGDAGNPDEVVPFDTNMNLIFLGIGLVFATFVVLKQLNKKKATNI